MLAREVSCREHDASQRPGSFAAGFHGALIPVKAIPEELPRLVFVNLIARRPMNTLAEDVSGKRMVTAFCLLVFGVFLAIVVSNLA